MMKALVVDNRPARQKLLISFLRIRGATWAVTRGWADALVMLGKVRARGGRIDVMLFSWENSGGSCKDAVEAARLLEPGVKFFVYTSAVGGLPEVALEIADLSRGDIAATFEPFDYSIFSELMDGLGLHGPSQLVLPF